MLLEPELDELPLPLELLLPELLPVPEPEELLELELEPLSTKVVELLEPLDLEPLLLPFELLPVPEPDELLPELLELLGLELEPLSANPVGLGDGEPLPLVAGFTSVTTVLSPSFFSVKVTMSSAFKPLSSFTSPTATLTSLETV